MAAGVRACCFARLPHQIADRDYRRAPALFGLAKEKGSHAMAALVFRRGHIDSVSNLALECAPDRRALLSAPLFWRGRFSNHESRLVLADRSADSLFESNPDAF